MAHPKARLEKGSPEAQARMRELSEKAKAARTPKVQPPTPPVTLAPDFSEFTGSMGATFSPQGTFFNPSTVFDPRISLGAPFPPEGK